MTQKPISWLTIAGPMVGVIAGSVGMWWSMEDRMEKKVAERVKLEARVARVEERIEALKDEFRNATKP